MSDNEKRQFEEEEFTAQFNGQVLRRIFALTKPHWPMMVGFLASIILVSLLDGYFTFLSKRMIDEGIIPGDRAQLFRLAGQYGLLIIAQSALAFTFIYLVGALSQRVRYDLRKKLFDHLQELSFSYFDRTPVGWIMSRVASDTERVGDLVSWSFLDATWAVINVGASFYFMMKINWQLALIVITVLPVLVVVAIYFKKLILVEYRKVRKLNSRITGAFNENITGVRVTKAFNREEKSLEAFADLSHDRYRAGFRAGWLSALFLPVVQIISAAAIGVVVVVGGLQVETGALTIGGIQAFISYIAFMLWPVQDLARVYASTQQAIASAERIFSLLDTPPEVQDRPNAVEVETLRLDIEFDHVDFWYEKDKPVLQDFTLTVRQGETIALVGPTGGGKSTIVNLLCRFYEPKTGVIRFGGRDYITIKLSSIHSRLGIVLQSPHLFSGTIRENIRYGRLDATDEEIEEAAKLAGAHEFIIELEHGYDTEVGEGGVLLSTGQKQLISLARAVLADPDIFIMDEATSSVDTVTENLIQRGMEEMMRGRTSFVIAHRLSTIRRASRILFIENGRIVEQGTHFELLRQRGRYYQLYTHQFRRELERQSALLGGRAA
ncbi:MAG TPA: ABC transporter ATP-binding protein [Anaerolineae bacterium]|nr:ABC transporter ATP-binding protein [Anaerolineae bacterium]